MKTQSIARVCGILYILTVIAFLFSNLFLNEQLVDAENITYTFQLLAENAFQYRLSVSIDFLAMVAVMGLVFSLYAVLKTVHPYLALLALGLRIGEVVIQASAAIPDYLLLGLSQSAASASGAGITELSYLGQLLIIGSTWALWLSFVFLSIGSLFNNWLFYKGKLIPSGLAIFGLIATVLYTGGSLAKLIIELPESVNQGLMLPLAIFELSLGFYLALFGLKQKSPAVEAEELSESYPGLG